MLSNRKILTLKSQDNKILTDGAAVDIGNFDVLLPARIFKIKYKIAELGKVSLTTEFLLRLLYSIDGITEKNVSTFFDFNQTEMSFLLREAENFGYINRSEGRIWLTDAGRNLFVVGSDEPQIFLVDQREDRIGFDLVSLAYQEFKDSLVAFERSLPELPANKEIVSVASRRIEKSFKRHFMEFITRRDTSAASKKSLYSIDEVIPDDRFSCVLPITLRANAKRPSSPDVYLGDWKPEHEINDREAVVTAIGTYVDSLRITKRPDDDKAYDLLVNFAPKVFKSYVRRDGFSVEGCFIDCLLRAREFRRDRPTVPIIGSLTTAENFRRLFDALGYGLEKFDSGSLYNHCFWLVPGVRSWGMTRALTAVIQSVHTRLDAGQDHDENKSECVAITYSKLPRYLDIAFDSQINASGDNWFPYPLEIFLIPNTVTAVLVNLPILSSFGHVVPMGFISFDSNIVKDVAHFIRDGLTQYSEFSEHFSNIPTI